MADIDYSKINFQNEPNHTTPLSAENLNKMDTAIYDLVVKSNSLVPNPVDAPTEGLEKLEYDGTVYEVKGGHKILNDSGSVLTQVDNMKFNGVYTHNTSTITEVEIVREYNSASAITSLTGEEAKGFQAIINGNSYEPFKATDIGFNKTGTSYTSDDVDGVLREVDTALSKPIGYKVVWTGSAYNVNDEIEIADFSTLKLYVFVFKGFSSANVLQFVTIPFANLQFIIQGETSQYVRFRITFQTGNKYKIIDKYGTGDANAGLINIYEIVK